MVLIIRDIYPTTTHFDLSLYNIEFQGNLKAIITRTLNSNGVSYGHISASKRKFLHNMITSLSDELVAKLDKNRNGVIDWKEFKSNLDLIQTRISEVKSYIHVNILNLS